MNPWVDRAFVKMHGGGNDFILVDDREDRIDVSGAARMVRALCHRRRGIGADGLIVIKPSTRADVGWRFFNADGSEAEMCGNGARCAARYAYGKDMAPKDMALETRAGIVHASVLDDSRVRLGLPRPSNLVLDEELNMGDEALTVSSIHAGVPHAVIFVDRLEAYPVVSVGRKVRNHARYQPEGTNVTFVRVLDSNRIAVRTYERGVEDETLSCGTGAVAAAIVCIKKGLARSPVRAAPPGGETLTVHAVSPSGSSFEGVLLEGGATMVCAGRISHEVLSSEEENDVFRLHSGPGDAVPERRSG